MFPTAKAAKPSPLDINVTGKLVVPDVLLDEWPSLSQLAAAQREHKLSPTSVNKYTVQHREDFDVVVDAGGRLVVPTEAADLKYRLLCIAHQGAAGHCGVLGTGRQLEKIVTWHDCKEDVVSFCKHCLQCIKCQDGSVVPRPWGLQLQPETFNEVIHADFCYRGPSDSGPVYLFVVKDGLTQLTMFFCTFDNTALTAILCVLM